MGTGPVRTSSRRGPTAMDESVGKFISHASAAAPVRQETVDSGGM